MDIVDSFAAISPIDDGGVEKAIQLATECTLAGLDKFTDEPKNHSSVDGVYAAEPHIEWTSGFWPGQIWLAFEHSNDERLKKSGLVHVDNFLNRIEKKIEVNHHDMGFLYSPSCVAPFKLLGNEKGREAALLAAEHLSLRFHEKGQFLQAWGTLGAADNYRYIIDCLLNIPLLHWAAEQTGDERYKTIAISHAQTTLAHSIRDDFSTHHTFYMDMQTGAPLRGETCQGYDHNSAWARGQAWGVYGLALCYRFDKKDEYLEAFNGVLDYYMSRLPKDLVPYWDLKFTDGDEPRDSSSAAIVVCGLLEMARHAPKEQAAKLENIARKMMASLVENYMVREVNAAGGLIEHGTYSKKTPFNTCTGAGVDEFVIWGDYFFMEALIRLTKNWAAYW